MKNQKPNKFIAALFGAKRISRVILTAYILVPILIFAVGFASWTTLTTEIGFSVNGSFISNELLDSTKYVSLKDENAPFSTTTTIGGFTTPDGDIVDTTSFAIDFNVKIGHCQALFSDEAGGKLYFTFGLCFSDRTEVPYLFETGNFEYETTISWTDDDDEQNSAVLTATPATLKDMGVKASLSRIKPAGAADYTNETATSSSYVFVMVLEFLPEANADYVSLKESAQISINVNYTLTPQTATHYRALMDVIFDDDNKTKALMSDVRITDYAPYPTNN